MRTRGTTVERRCYVRCCASLDGLTNRLRRLPVEVVAGLEFVATHNRSAKSEITRPEKNSDHHEVMDRKWSRLSGLHYSSPRTDSFQPLLRGFQPFSLTFQSPLSPSLVAKSVAMSSQATEPIGAPPQAPHQRTNNTKNPTPAGAEVGIRLQDLKDQLDPTR